MSSFRQLSRGKFEVIHALERHLPARLFTAEWIALGRGVDPQRYRPFIKTEETPPLVFAGLHALSSVRTSTCLRRETVSETAALAVKVLCYCKGR